MGDGRKEGRKLWFAICVHLSSLLLLSCSPICIYIMDSMVSTLLSSLCLLECVLIAFLIFCVLVQDSLCLLSLIVSLPMLSYVLLCPLSCLPTSLLCLSACPVCSYPPIDCVSTFTLVYLYLYDSLVLLVLLACSLDLPSWLRCSSPDKSLLSFRFCLLGFLVSYRTFFGFSFVLLWELLASSLVRVTYSTLNHNRISFLSFSFCVSPSLKFRSQFPIPHSHPAFPSMDSLNSLPLVLVSVPLLASSSCLVSS